MGRRGRRKLGDLCPYEVRGSPSPGARSGDAPRLQAWTGEAASGGAAQMGAGGGSTLLSALGCASSPTPGSSPEATLAGHSSRPEAPRAQATCLYSSPIILVLISRTLPLRDKRPNPATARRQAFSPHPRAPTLTPPERHMTKLLPNPCHPSRHPDPPPTGAGHTEPHTLALQGLTAAALLSFHKKPFSPFFPQNGAERIGPTQRAAAHLAFSPGPSRKPLSF